MSCQGDSDGLGVSKISIARTLVYNRDDLRLISSGKLFTFYEVV